MPSPICLVNGASTTDGYDAAGGSTITIALADTTGVSSWSLECIGTDETHSAATITSSLSINSNTKTATLVVPSDVGGSALIFRSTVNNSRDSNGTYQSSYSTTFGVFVLTAAGYRLMATNETTEGNATYGWVDKFNQGIRGGYTNPTGSAGGDLSGTYPGPTVAKLQNISVLAGTPTDGYGLVYSSSNTRWEYQPVVFYATAFGGNVSGTYNNLSIIKNNVASVSSSPYSVGSTDNILLVDTSAARTINLPSPSAGRIIRIKDKTGGGYDITLARYGSESIEGVAANYTIAASASKWVSVLVVSDGTNWFVLDK